MVNTFKYLGIEYTPLTGTIKGKTRNGSNLEFDEKRSNLFELLKELKPDYDYSNLDHLVHSNVLGLVMSKLYIGDWEDIPMANSK